MLRVLGIIWVLLFASTILIQSSAQNKVILDSLINIVERNISPKKEIDTYIQIANEYRESDSINTVKYAQRAINLASKINYPEGRIDALYEIGWVTMKKRDYPKAEQLFLQILTEADSLKGKAKGLYGLGMVSRHQNKHKKALDYYFKALKIKEEIEDLKGLGSLHNSIGIVYKNQGNYDKAIEYYLKSLSFRKELEDEQGVSTSYNNIGIIYMRKGNYKQALNFYFNVSFAFVTN